MKKLTNLGLIFLTTLLGLSCLITITRADTTIGSSTFPAENGDFYEWICTSCDPMWDYIGVGSWLNVTIDNIYQGSHMAVPYALIVNATTGQYIKGQNLYSLYNIPDYLVYNATLNYIYLDHKLILPIPLNLTLVKEFVENQGTNCSVVGNELVVDSGLGRVDTYTYNSAGFATKIKATLNSSSFVFKLGGTGALIPFGGYFVYPSIITVAVIIVIGRKRFKKMF